MGKIELSGSCVEKYLSYREDIEYNFDALLIQSDTESGLSVEIICEDDQKGRDALDFMRSLSISGPERSKSLPPDEFDIVPFSGIFKPILTSCFQGYLQRILEFKYKGKYK